LRDFITQSPEETFQLGRTIGEGLTSGALLLLKGELGSGKTLFTKGIAAGLNIDPADVTSPSFTLINAHQGRLPLYHIDLYRLEPESVSSLGLEEVFADERAVVVVEWAERLRAVSQPAVEINFEYISPSERKITMGGGPKQS